MILNFDGRDCNYVIRWSQLLFGAATGTSWDMGNSSHLYEFTSLVFWGFFPLTVKMVTYWNSLPKWGAESLCLEILKTKLDEPELLCAGAQTTWPPQPHSFQPNLCYNLCHKIFHPVCQFTGDFFRNPMNLLDIGCCSYWMSLILTIVLSFTKKLEIKIKPRVLGNCILFSI